MSLRQILLPLLGADSDSAAISGACRMAKQFGSHIAAVLPRPDPADALPYLGEGVSGAIVADIVEAAQKAADDAAETAKALIEKLARTNGVPLVESVRSPGSAEISFWEREGPSGSVLRHEARLADLVVFGRRGDGAIAMPDGLEEALLGIGRPVCVMPPEAPESVGRHVLVGWDGSLEASNALRAARPFLTTAGRVEIVEIGSGEHSRSADLAAFLRLYEITPGYHLIAPTARSPGEMLLDHAAQQSADLLVLGGYGHSRMREMLLGGVTRTVLAEARLPLLLAH